MVTQSVACVIIATARRKALVHERVLPSVQTEGFDEIVVVADWHDTLAAPTRWLCVDDITHSTLDALIKRDIGALATTSDTVMYLCDDHALAPHFGAALRATLDEPWDAIVPNRYTIWCNQRIELNNGEADKYCGGHAGIFRRKLLDRFPWIQWKYTLFWDRESSYAHRNSGANYIFSPRSGISVEDLEPERSPWL